MFYMSSSNKEIYENLFGMYAQGCGFFLYGLFKFILFPFGMLYLFVKLADKVTVFGAIILSFIILGILYGIIVAIENAIKDRTIRKEQARLWEIEKEEIAKKNQIKE